MNDESSLPIDDDVRMDVGLPPEPVEYSIPSQESKPKVIAEQNFHEDARRSSSGWPLYW